MKNLVFSVFKKEEKELLEKSLVSNRTSHRKWCLWNFIIPLLIFILPIGLSISLENDKSQIIQILVNGNLPLIPVMILISLITIDLSNAKEEKKIIKSIESKISVLALVLGLLAVTLYIVETIKDNSDVFLIYVGFSLLSLMCTYITAMIYFLLQKRSIDTLKTEVKESRKNISESNMAN
jgi:hypothetical protein